MMQPRGNCLFSRATVLTLVNPDLSFFENSVDPDQIRPSVIRIHSCFPTLIEKCILPTGMLQVNRIKIGEECSRVKYLACQGLSTLIMKCSAKEEEKLFIEVDKLQIFVFLSEK